MPATRKSTIKKAAPATKAVEATSEVAVAPPTLKRIGEVNEEIKLETNEQKEAAIASALGMVFTGGKLVSIREKEMTSAVVEESKSKNPILEGSPTPKDSPAVEENPRESVAVLSECVVRFVGKLVTDYKLPLEELKVMLKAEVDKITEVKKTRKSRVGTGKLRVSGPVEVDVQAEKKPGCEYIWSKGERKDEKCGRPLKENGLCSTHLRASLKPKSSKPGPVKCKGKSKDSKPCGSNASGNGFCYNHRKQAEPAAEPAAAPSVEEVTEQKVV